VGEVCAVSAGESPAARFNPAYFEQLFRIEDRHFWFHTRNRILSAVVAQITASLPGDCKVLEIGCGNGNVLRHLQQACAGRLVVGMDAFEEGLRLARRRNCPRLVRGDATQHPFRSQFDLVGLFDVLEHVPEDERLLQQIRGILRPGGVLLITVPARMSLWSYFDEASGHCRRYELDELRRKLDEAGYQVEYLTPYMAMLLPLMWLGRRLATLTRGLRGKASPTDMAMRELQLIPGINGMLRFCLAREFPLVVGRRGLPFGTSLLALARNGRAIAKGPRRLISSAGG
jgi:SAM-dependent methyltransferase